MEQRKFLRIFLWLVFPVLIIAAYFISRQINLPGRKNKEDTYIGSAKCRDCHEKFYDLWAPSHHGLAMRNMTPEFLNQFFAEKRSKEIRVDSSLFHVEIGNDSLFFFENKDKTLSKYPAVFALGGKNVFYFLTTFSRGRLQVLPLAYDVKRKEWYNNPESALRIFGTGDPDQVLPWKHTAYTFNTSCWSCHVSQLTNNYDLSTHSYHTAWKENGINCETCHGPADDHVRACVKSGDEVPDDLKIISARSFNHEQQNSNCGSCHAKMHFITGSYPPGGRFFDYFDLITLENPDYYPDGRDLGENYTYTSWLQSPCIRNGNLDCIHCHTSSGRYRFKDENKNNACLPCHEKQVAGGESHSHHPAGTEGALCISCHMPKTEFARMIRSDHSMRPPDPLASKEFGSPNACNICHTDKPNDWSQSYLVKWGKNNLQKEMVEKGMLIRDARKNNWNRLDKMLVALREYRSDPVFSASMIRLLRENSDERKWPAIMDALDNPSPLVRSAAAISLSVHPTDESFKALLDKCKDPYRLVRKSAAESLSAFPVSMLQDTDSASYGRAMHEYIASITAREDDWASYANLGSFYLNRQQFDKAQEQYRISLNLFPENVEVLVNSGLLDAILGNPDQAESKFKKAIELAPENEVSYLNYALLLGEMKRYEEAKANYEKVLNINPHSGVAAYNLSVIESSDNPASAISYARIASQNEPLNPKYVYTLGYFLYKNNQYREATRVMEKMILDFPSEGDAYLLLYEIYRASGHTRQADEFVKKILNDTSLDERIRIRFRQLQ